MAEDKIVLGYWALRGLGQFLRYLLEFAEVDYEEKRYYMPTADEWFGRDKSSLGFAYPNLPYIIDGEKKLTQSRTLAIYITKKYNLAGASGDAEFRVSMAYDALTDVRTAWAKLVNSEGFEEEKGEFVDVKCSGMLKHFENAAAKGSYIAGTATPSFADFALYDTLDQLYFLSPGLKSKFPKLKAWFNKVDALPQIAKYKRRSVGSKSFIDTPFWSPAAKFGTTRA